MEALQLDLAVPVAQAGRALDAAVETWDGEWTEPSRAIWLPVSAGIRRGLLRAEVAIEESPDGSRITLRPVERRDRVNRAAAGVLALGAFGGGVAILWPFFPALLRFAPVAAILAVVAWLTVAGRLRGRGLEEFLDLVRRLADEG
jgi:hypothetical protein